MKKVIALLTMMAVFSTAVFAAPLSVAGSLGTTSGEITMAGYQSGGSQNTLSREVFHAQLSAKTDAHNDFDDLFADVQAAALTAEEAGAVEGDGLLGLVIGGILLGTGIGAGAAILGINLLAPMLP